MQAARSIAGLHVYAKLALLALTADCDEQTNVRFSPFILLDGKAENDMRSPADEKNFEKGVDWQPDT